MTNHPSRAGPGWAARLICALLLLTGSWALVAQGQGLADALARLADRSFSVKQEALQAIAASGDPRALAVLKALRDGELQVRSEDQRVVVARKCAAGLRLADPLSGDDLGRPMPDRSRRSPSTTPCGPPCAGASPPSPWRARTLGCDSLPPGS